MKIDDVSKSTGLSKPFINKCLREMKDIFLPYMSKGENNCNLFDSNSLVIFDQIKQDKDKRLSLSQIKKHLYSQMDEPDNLDKPYEPKTYELNKTEQSRAKPENNSPSYFEVEQLKNALHKAEKQILTLEYEKQIRENNLKFLPAGGDPETYAQMLAVLEVLEKDSLEKEKSVFDIFGRRVKNKKTEWNRLKALLKGEK